MVIISNLLSNKKSYETVSLQKPEFSVIKIDFFSPPKDEVYEFDIPKKSRIKKATLDIIGEKYVGAVNIGEPGISINRFSKKTMIVDFHKFTNICGVTKKIGTALVDSIRTWMGVKFSRSMILFTEDEDVYRFPDEKTEKIMIEFDREINLDLFIKNFKIYVSSVPSNVTLKIGDGNPFWGYSGELSTSVTVPDFTQILQSYIDEYDSQELCKVRFLLQSDSYGFLKVDEDINYTILCEDNIEKQLSFEGKEKKIIILHIKNAVQIHKIDLHYSGLFSEDYVNASADEISNIGVRISPGTIVGLRFQPTQDINLTGFDLSLVKHSEELEAFLEIVDDDNGYPSGTNIISSLRLDTSVWQIGEVGWFPIKFNEVISIHKNVFYWLILKISVGQAEWFCINDRPSENNFMFRKEISDKWTPFPVSGGYRLKYLPNSRGASPLILKIFNLGDQFLFPSEESQSFSMDLTIKKVSDGEKVIDLPLEFSSNASGELRITSIVVEYTESE